MCGQFLVVPKEVVEEIVRDIIMKRMANAMPDWPARKQEAPEDAQPDTPAEAEPEPQVIKQSVFPGGEATIIVPTEGSLSAQTMQWGYPVTWNKQVVFNTRFDTATRPGRNMWADSLANRRCLVPTFGFFEPHQSETFINPRTGKPNKQKYLFTSPDSPLVFLAGVYERGSFSLMTTEPNSIMLPIHRRMPVILEPREFDTWLFGDYLSLEDRSSVELLAEKLY